MKIADVELSDLHLPFTPQGNKHLQYWIPGWRNVQLCKLTLENGTVGWGETIPHATHAQVPADIEDRILGEEAAGLLWHDDLGAGAQLALFDAVGKSQNVSACDLLGERLRDWCAISWWACDMPPGDWARQCGNAVAAGYMSAKFKSRPWQDLHACIQAGIAAVPPQFRFDLDFNGHLVNASNAVPFLKSLEQYDTVAMIETPISQRDVAGNVHIRERINRPLAQHFGDPPIMTALREDVTDGLIIGGGALQLMEQVAVLKAANKPFWLQLVGTGITTTWAAHIAAVCSQARWPAITCMNIYESQLIKRPIEVRGGYYQVPEGPGLGIEIDERALKKYRVSEPRIDLVRHIYTHSRVGGESVCFATTNRSAFHGAYTTAGLPICEHGSTLDITDDDGSTRFAKRYGELKSAGDLDAVYFALHGAAASESVHDTEGHLLSAVRAIVGPDFPVVISLDHHANLTQSMVEKVNGLVAHRAQPHDQFETGMLAGRMLISMLRKETRPVVAWRNIPLITHQEQFLTAAGPMKAWFDLAREMEGRPGVIAASPFPMQPWLDVPEGGWSVAVVTDDDTALAGQLAAELANDAWARREDFCRLDSISPEMAVRNAVEAENGLIVLTDTGDSVFGGATGDSTCVLEEMLKQCIEQTALVPMVDPETVHAAVSAGVGALIQVTVGGKLDPTFGRPLEIEARVAGIGGGRFEISLLGYESFDTGRAALLEVGAVKLLVSEKRGIGGNHPAVYEQFGLDIADARMVVVKTASNWQFYQQWISQVIRVDTPGATMSHLDQFEWQHLPRPIYPLDELAEWRAAP